MFLVNAVMLSTFLKALQSSGSTVATVTNFATNFLLSVSFFFLVVCFKGVYM